MIRDYKPVDASALVTIWLAASAVAHPFLSEEFISQEADNLRDAYLCNTRTWVIEHEGASAGFIALMGNEIGGLFLGPRFHGKGMGKALLEHARSLVSPLEVEVFANNKVGRPFYERQGFVEMRRYLHDETGQDVIRMILK